MIENIYDCSNNTRPIKYQSQPQLQIMLNEVHFIFVLFSLFVYFRNPKNIVSESTTPCAKPLKPLSKGLA